MSMTVDECRQHLMKLNHDLYTTVSAFERETGLRINVIDINRARFNTITNPDDVHVLQSVDARVMLDEDVVDKGESNEQQT